MNSKSKLHLLVSAMIAGSTLGIVGCASVNTKPSGFLASYEQIQPLDSKDKTRTYRDGSRAAAYHAMIIEPVTLQTNAAAKLPKKRQVELSDSLTERARKVFAGHYQLVTEADAGALRLRITVNDLNKSSPIVNLITTAAAYLPLDMGAVAVEMEAVDSLTGQRVVALMGSRHGWPVTPSGFFGSFRPTGHARSQFSNLSRQMQNLLSEVPRQSRTESSAEVNDAEAARIRKPALTF